MRWALVVALLALAAGVACAKAAVTAAPGSAPAAVPATLQALEGKMRQLQVNSERFSQVARGSITVANRTNGKVVGRVKHISANGQLTGEASLTPQRSETFLGARHTPARIVIGSTVYSHERGRRRPWVRLHEPGLAQSFAAYPLHGNPEEANLGGTGSYAGLLNLLATAVGQIGSDAPAVIDGQRTEAFSATVEPLRLVKHLTDEDVNNLRRHRVIERLEVFLTEAGLPIKVVQALDSAEVHVTTTTQILAVNVPINVKPPPARETTGAPRRLRRALSIAASRGRTSRHRCPPAGAHVIAHDRVLRVYSTGPRSTYTYTVGACRPGASASMTLLPAPSQRHFGLHRSVGQFVLAGDFVGYIETQFGVDSGTTTLIVVDAASRRRVHEIAAGHYVDAGFVFSEGITDFVVSDRGSVAWITERGKGGPRGSLEGRSVQVVGPAGIVTVADTSTTIDPTSLRLSGHTLSWSDGDVRRTAHMP